MDINQLSLPENFYTRTSDELLLQPEPQYVFATMFRNAVLQELGIPAGMGLPIPGREITGEGAGYVTPESQQFDINAGRTIQSQAFAVAVDLNGEPGSTVRFNRPVYQDTTYTEASREVGPNATISTTPIVVGSEQNTITLKRFAGPYDAVNTRVAPYAIDAFSAQLGIHKLTEIVGGNLKRDYTKFIDSIYVLLGEAVSTTVYPFGFTADNDITTAGAAPMQFKVISRTERLLDDANIPYFATGKRIMVCTPQQLEELKDDAQYARYSEFHREMNAIFPEYVASIGKFDILKSNTLRKVANSSSVNVNRGLAFGPGMFGAGYGRPPKVAAASDDNYGETAKVIWLAYLAFKLMDSRFGISFRTG